MQSKHKVDIIFLIFLSGVTYSSQERSWCRCFWRSNVECLDVLSPGATSFIKMQIPLIYASAWLESQEFLAIRSTSRTNRTFAKELIQSIDPIHRKNSLQLQRVCFLLGFPAFKAQTSSILREIDQILGSVTLRKFIEKLQLQDITRLRFFEDTLCVNFDLEGYKGEVVSFGKIPHCSITLTGNRSKTYISTANTGSGNKQEPVVYNIYVKAPGMNKDLYLVPFTSPFPTSSIPLES